MENKFSDEILVYLREKSCNNMSKSLFEKISHLIVSGKLPQGYMFPNENDMSDILSIGRSTIREAYTALSVLGYITRSKSGTRVNEVSNVVNIAPFSTTLGTSDIRDLVEFRFMLEAEIASYAAKRATKEEIQGLYEANDKMRNYFNDSRQFARCDSQFHMQVAYASHNKVLISTMIAARDSFERYIRNAFSSVSEKEQVLFVAVDLHKKVIEAIENGDHENAYRITKEHINYVSVRANVTSNM